MGAEPWMFSTPYQENIDQALQQLRQQVFSEGRYSKADPEANPASIEELFASHVEEDGTHSILDIFTIGKNKRMGVSCPLADEDLIGIFGTIKPTKEMVANEHEVYDFIDRGESVYIIAYTGEVPDELFFFGYSFD